MHGCHKATLKITFLEVSFVYEGYAVKIKVTGATKACLRMRSLCNLKQVKLNPCSHVFAGRLKDKISVYLFI